VTVLARRARSAPDSPYLFSKECGNVGILVVWAADLQSRR